MTSVLGGRGTVITGLSVGEGGRKVIEEIQVYALTENVLAKYAKQ